MEGEDARAALAAELRLLSWEYPGWHMWPGIGGGVYARRRNWSPPVVVHGATVARLRAEITVRGYVPRPDGGSMPG